VTVLATERHKLPVELRPCGRRNGCVLWDSDGTPRKRHKLPVRRRKHRCWQRGCVASRRRRRRHKLPVNWKRTALSDADESVRSEPFSPPLLRVCPAPAAFQGSLERPERHKLPVAQVPPCRAWPVTGSSVGLRCRYDAPVWMGTALRAVRWGDASQASQTTRRIPRLVHARV
jgi:hypothetical protein